LSRQRSLRWLNIGALALMAGCALLAKPVDPAEKISRQLNQLQVDIEEGIHGNEPVHVAVLGILDTAALSAPNPDAGKAKPPEQASLEEAWRRERVIRQELSSILVKNRLLALVQPTQLQIDEARDAMIAGNSAALNEDLVKKLGSLLASEYLICAFSDDEGKAVSLVAQRSSDGVVIYQETLKDWPVLAAPAETE
jgi:hypothetical protein